MTTAFLLVSSVLVLTVVSLAVWTFWGWRVLRHSRRLTIRERDNIETALRAFPIWPYNRRPFIWVGIQIVGAAVVRHCSPER